MQFRGFRYFTYIHICAYMSIPRKGSFVLRYPSLLVELKEDTYIHTNNRIIPSRGMSLTDRERGRACPLRRIMQMSPRREAKGENPYSQNRYIDTAAAHKQSFVEIQSVLVLFPP